MQVIYKPLEMDAHTGEETISSKKVNGHGINPCGMSTILKYGRESEVCKSNRKTNHRDRTATTTKILKYMFRNLENNLRRKEYPFIFLKFY